MERITKKELHKKNYREKITQKELRKKNYTRELHGENYTDTEIVTGRDIHGIIHKGKYMEKQTRE